MSEAARIGDVEGGAALREWFGIEPSFHDSALLALELQQGGESYLKARTFRMGPETDAEGYYVINKRVEVTFRLSRLIEAELYEITEQGVIDGLSIYLADDGVELCWDAAYGAHGRLKAEEVSISFTPLISSRSD